MWAGLPWASLAGLGGPRLVWGCPFRARTERNGELLRPRRAVGLFVWCDGAALACPASVLVFVVVVVLDLVFALLKNQIDYDDDDERSAIAVLAFLWDAVR